MQRTDKNNYYLDIAETVLERGTCLRRNFGAIIVKTTRSFLPDTPVLWRGRENCIDLGVCLREKMQIPRGERYELCRSIHAEANAIISAARDKMIGATMYLAGREAESGEFVNNMNSCSMCKRMIINAGIDRVVIRRTPPTMKRSSCATAFNDDSLSGSSGY